MDVMPTRSLWCCSTVALRLGPKPNGQNFHLLRPLQKVFFCMPSSRGSKVLRFLVPKTRPLVVFGTGVLRYWVLGPSGIIKKKPEDAQDTRDLMSESLLPAVLRSPKFNAQLPMVTGCFEQLDSEVLSPIPKSLLPPPEIPPAQRHRGVRQVAGPAGSVQTASYVVP